MASDGDSMVSDLGSIMRLTNLQASDLPSHSKWASGTDNPADDGERPSLKAFIETALLESHAFINDMHGLKYPSYKIIKSPPSTADAVILKKTVTANDLQTKVKWNSSLVPSRRTSPTTKSELWVARRSIHKSESKEGTATWQEFCDYDRSHHSHYEAEYTPDIYERKEMVSWASEISELSFENLTDVEMELVEMDHKLPAPLKPRSFCTLVLSGNVTADCFVVAQIPVDANSLPASVYNSGGSKNVRGIYVSIERCERQSDQNIIWTLATASDAGGNVPQFVQNMGIPGAIAKDVGLFVKWVAGRRGGG